LPLLNSHVSAAQSASQQGRGQAAVKWLLAVTLVFAPLFRSGQPALATLVLELLALGILLLVFWQRRRDLVTRGEAWALTLLLVLPLLYLLPLPASLVGWLPGWKPYLAGLSLIGEGTSPGALTLSVYPLETESAFLLLLVPVGVFLGTRFLEPRQAFRLLLLLLGIASAQALLGLLQYGTGAGTLELFGISVADLRSAQGTYTNRNHFAGLIEMALPAALALTVYYAGRRRDRGRSGWRQRVAFLATVRGHAAVVYGAVALLLVLAVIFTRSRAGIALSMLGIMLSIVMFAWRIGGDNVYGVTGTIVAIALGAAVAIGLVPVLDRFSVGGAIEDARWTIFSSTLEGIGAFAPLGSGPGNYPDVFPAFQPLELGRWFINHAHNDYLEWLFEGGLLAAGLILLLLVLYARQWGRVWTKGAWSRGRFVQVAAGIGLLLLLLHSLVDFNLHMPGNIVYFAFLAGLFFADSNLQADPVKRRRRRTPTLDASAMAPAPVPEAPAPAPADQIRNPFLD
jgi:O-antigen ligase